MHCSKNVTVADSVNVNLMQINFKKCKLELANWLTTSMVQIFMCTSFCPFARKMSQMCKN